MREFPRKKIDEMEARNLSDRKFRVMIIRIQNSMKKHTEIMKRTSQNYRMQYLK